jgi:hypothetical protein
MWNDLIVDVEDVCSAARQKPIASSRATIATVSSAATP